MGHLRSSVLVAAAMFSLCCIAHAQREGHGMPVPCTPGPYIEERLSVPRRSVEGGLSRDAVARALLSQRMRLGHCVSTAFGRAEHTSFDVEITLVVGANGTVQNATAQSTAQSTQSTASAELVPCLEFALLRTPFPTLDGGVDSRVRATLRFTPTRRIRRCGS